MSFKAMQWAMKQTLPTMQKMVLVTLANRFNDDTGYCYPSHELLAKESGMTKMSVIRQIEKLETLNLITVQRDTDERGFKKVNYYKLPIKSSNTELHRSNTELHRSNTEAQKVVTESYEGSNTELHETVIEPVNINITTNYAHENLENSGLKLNALHREVFEWACTDSYWVKCTDSEDEFLRAYCSPKGGMRKQFEKFKKTGGNNATRQQHPKPAKVSAADRVERAIAERFGNATESIIELDKQQYHTA